ncbi:tRNA-dihydrouridine(47) synthase-like [Diplonema papillatum]|nr:tRNA-dihydrouridine(47) synthase-like [Diplonema papillatum]
MSSAALVEEVGVAEKQPGATTAPQTTGSEAPAPAADARTDSEKMLDARKPGMCYVQRPYQMTLATWAREVDAAKARLSAEYPEPCFPPPPPPKPEEPAPGSEPLSTATPAANAPPATTTTPPADAASKAHSAAGPPPSADVPMQGQTEAQPAAPQATTTTPADAASKAAEGETTQSAAGCPPPSAGVPTAPKEKLEPAQAPEPAAPAATGSEPAAAAAAAQSAEAPPAAPKDAKELKDGTAPSTAAAAAAATEAAEPLPLMCCDFISKGHCKYPTCKFAHTDGGQCCQYKARCREGHAERGQQEKRKRANDGGEPATKRARGSNKGRAKLTHRLQTRGDKPTWAGEKNFIPESFFSVWRPKVSSMRRRSDWTCALCKNRNQAKYNSYSCYACFKLITDDVDQKSRLVGGKEQGDQPASAGWYEPRAKKKIDWEGKTYLSPLTTVGNLPFRRICSQFGVDITCSEMACADNLLRFQSSEWSLLRRHESELQYGLQVACSSPTEGAMLGKLLAELNYDYDFVDLNCGCPIDVMINRGMGSALIETRNQKKLRGILTGLHFQPKPVTLKVRIGADERSPTLHTWIDQIADWGADAITIHGRSRRQRYSKLANWDYIQTCAEKSPVPVIGNGDLLDYTGWNQRIASGVAGAMTGRGALIKPWLFTEIKEQRHWDISSHERFEMLKDYAKKGMDHWGADMRGRATTRRFMCEWLGFLCRYVPVGIIETMPQKHNERPDTFRGRNDLETLMGSDKSEDWIKISELILGPCEPGFVFVPKHKSSAYSVSRDGHILKQEDKPVDVE